MSQGNGRQACLAELSHVKLGTDALVGAGLRVLVPACNSLTADLLQPDLRRQQKAGICHETLQGTARSLCHPHSRRPGKLTKQVLVYEVRKP